MTNKVEEKVEIESNQQQKRGRFADDYDFQTDKEFQKNYEKNVWHKFENGNKNDAPYFASSKPDSDPKFEAQQLSESNNQLNQQIEEPEKLIPVKEDL